MQDSTIRPSSGGTPTPPSQSSETRRSQSNYLNRPILYANKQILEHFRTEIEKKMQIALITFSNKTPPPKEEKEKGETKDSGWGTWFSSKAGAGVQKAFETYGPDAINQMISYIGKKVLGVTPPREASWTNWVSPSAWAESASNKAKEASISGLQILLTPLLTPALAPFAAEAGVYGLTQLVGLAGYAYTKMLANPEEAEKLNNMSPDELEKEMKQSGISDEDMKALGALIIKQQIINILLAAPNRQEALERINSYLIKREDGVDVFFDGSVLGVRDGGGKFDLSSRLERLNLENYSDEEINEILLAEAERPFEVNDALLVEEASKFDIAKNTLINMENLGQEHAQEILFMIEQLALHYASNPPLNPLTAGTPLEKELILCQDGMWCSHDGKVYSEKEVVKMLEEFEKQKTEKENEEKQYFETQESEFIKLKSEAEVKKEKEIIQDLSEKEKAEAHEAPPENQLPEND